MKNLTLLDKHRITGRWVIELYGTVGDDTCGLFMLASPVDDEALRIVAASGEGWDHVSVSRADRCPTWEEMEFVKRHFFNPYEIAIQFHVPEQEHINFHTNCLHLWRPLDQVIKLPPSIMVAPKTMLGEKE